MISGADFPRPFPKEDLKSRPTKVDANRMRSNAQTWAKASPLSPLAYCLAGCVTTFPE